MRRCIMKPGFDIFVFDKEVEEEDTAIYQILKITPLFC